VASAFTDQIEAARLSVLAALRAGDGPPDLGRIPELAEAAARERVPVQLTDGDAGAREVAGAAYFGPAMAIFFLFFTVSYGARSLLAERQQGTLPRILAAPAPAWAVLAGKALAVFVLGLASMTTMFVFMSVVFGIDFGDPLAVAALTVLTVLAVMAVTAVVQTLARNDQQADTLAQMLSISLALVGGNFFPIFQLPELIQRLSLATPNGWAIRGFTDLIYDGAGIADILPNLGAVAAFALVTGSIALVRSRRLALA
jgi:ABC-2 type transport system permease protein